MRLHLEKTERNRVAFIGGWHDSKPLPEPLQICCETDAPHGADPYLRRFEPILKNSIELFATLLFTRIVLPRSCGKAALW